MRRLDRAIHSLRARLDPCARASFHHLVLCVRARSTLLRETGARDDRAVLARALAALAAQASAWYRAPSAWLAPRGSPRVQLASFARHLLARYDVPAFMDGVWLEGAGEVLPQHRWYVHLATGGSVRTAGFPLPLTRAAAHALASVPRHLSVPEALRWAQVLGCGGGATLAAAVVATPLGRDLSDPDFWDAALRRLARRPDLDASAVARIVEHMRVQRALDPRWSLKGRTPESLARDAGVAHGQSRRADRCPPRPLARWRHAPIADGRFADAQGRTWTIVQLLTSHELREEGRAMHHCVATYASRCASRTTSIWSVSVTNLQGTFRVATVEVNLVSRALVQSRGHRDRPTGGVALEAIHHWAARAGIAIPRPILETRLTILEP